MAAGLAARERGVPLVNIAQPFKTGGLQVNCLKSAGIETPEDFPGHIMGVWFYGNEYPFYAWMASLGIETDGADENGVSVIKQAFSADPLIQGQADCISTMTYNEYGQVLGGIRLMPTTARCAAYSYMLRDAQLDLLDSIPNDVLFFEAPVDPRIWEATRLFIAEGVDAKRRPIVQRLLLPAMQPTAAEHGATSVIGIVPAVFSRWLKRIGMNAAPVGPKFNIDGTWSQAALFGLKDRLQ